MPLPKINSILYDVTIPSNKKVVKIAQLRARDEKILLTAKESTGSIEDRNIEILNSIKQVINNAIVTPGIDVETLALFDIEYLFIRLRALSVSNIIQASYQDTEEMQDYYKALDQFNNMAAKGTRPPVEPESYSFEIDLNKVEVVWPENITSNIKIPNNSIVIKMKYPSAELYTNKEFLAATGQKLLDYLVQNSLESVEQDGHSFWYPKDLPVAEVTEFLDGLPIGVFDKIREFLSNLPHLSYEIKYTNKKGNERKIVLSRLSDFFQF